MKHTILERKPRYKAREIVAFFEAHGLREVGPRHRGSHVKYSRDGMTRPITLDAHSAGDEIPVQHVKRWLDAAGLSHIWNAQAQQPAGKSRIKDFNEVAFDPGRDTPRTSREWRQQQVWLRATPAVLTIAA